MTTCSAADRDLPAAPFLLGATLLLVCLTLLHFHGMPRFQAAGPPVNLLPSGPDILDSRDVDAEPARVEILQPLADVAFIRVEARLAAQGIARGERRWQQGRLVAVQVRRDGARRLDLPHVVARLSGDRASRTYRATFRIAPDTQAVLLRAEVLRTTGRLALQALRVQPLQQRPGFSGGSWFIAGCWALLALLISGWVLRCCLHGRWRPALGYAVAAPALVLSVAPAAVTAPLRLGVARNLDLSGVAGQTGRAAEAALSASLFSLAKTGHVLMFASVGAVFLFALCWRRAALARPVLLAIGLSTCFGLVAEMLQLFSPNRTASLFDVSINLFSGTVGVLGATLLLSAWSRFSRAAGPRSGG